MNQEKYTCDYCNEQFIPTRKGVQRFCKSNCRKKYSYHKNKGTSKAKPKEEISQKLEELQNKKNKIEAVSPHGIGNSVAGSLLADGLTAFAKNVFTQEENKPATKGDIEDLKKIINNRFLLVENIKPDPMGRKAYFDVRTSKILYYDPASNKFHLPILDL
jgi:hypothetical protein